MAASAGQQEKAARFLELAKQAKLLPEEKRMLAEVSGAFKGREK